MSFADEIEAVVRKVLREELQRLAAVPADPDPLVPHTKWPGVSRRRGAELARAGDIQATRRGKLWFARQSAIEAWVRGEKPSPAPSPSPDREPTFEEMDAARAARRKRKAA